MHSKRYGRSMQTSSWIGQPLLRNETENYSVILTWSKLFSFDRTNMTTYGRETVVISCRLDDRISHMYGEPLASYFGTFTCSLWNQSTEEAGRVHCSKVSHQFSIQRSMYADKPGTNTGTLCPCLNTKRFLSSVTKHKNEVLTRYRETISKQ